ncbi:HD domain-containing protein [Hyphomicrobiales bacterium 4NK60-0047b]|jgi:5'-deoxynucleotidase YfbR-like HD superfamily hydrolase
MGELPKKPVRAWQRMLSGRRLDLLNPKSTDIEIEDIAHGLARVARWNGQTSGPHAFSVAEHSLFVMDILLKLKPDAPASWQMGALLHDAPEYVIGDLISPFKAAIGADYKVFELKILDAIHQRFGIASDLTEEVQRFIKRADEISAFYEAIYLAGFSLEEATVYFSAPESIDGDFNNWITSLEALSVRDAQAKFLERFYQLNES